MRRLKLENIKISKGFANTTPRKEKMEECRYNWRMYHRYDRYIVVNENHVLIDGYIMYLILKEHKEKYATVKVCTQKEKNCKKVEKKIIPTSLNKEITYIYGKHFDKNQDAYSKEYVWKVPKAWSEQGWEENISIGDEILVNTKFGCCPIIVTKIEKLEKCPVKFPIKKVASKKYCKKVE